MSDMFNNLYNLHREVVKGIMYLSFGKNMFFLEHFSDVCFLSFGFIVFKWVPRANQVRS